MQLNGNADDEPFGEVVDRLREATDMAALEEGEEGEVGTLAALHLTQGGLVAKGEAAEVAARINLALAEHIMLAGLPKVGDRAHELSKAEAERRLAKASRALPCP